MMISAIGQSFEVVRGAKGMDAPESLNDSFAWLKYVSSTLL